MSDACDYLPGLAPSSSSLVNQQTSRQRRTQRAGDRNTQHRIVSGDWDRRAGREACRPQPAEASETHFRHSGWLRDRARVRAALVACNVRAGRLDRFDECGANAVVEYSPSLKKHRIRGNYCGDRFCLPCGVARAQKATAKLLRLLGGRDCLKIELTIKGLERPLAESIDHLLASIVKLRRTDAFKKWCRAGFAFIEIKRGDRSGLWHPHLHVIADGSYISQKALSAAWFKATGDSDVVWISRVPADDDRLRYACKYAGKGWTREVATDHDSLVECVAALRGRRLVIPFGGWYGADPELEAPAATDWTRVDRITRVLEAVGRGESWAIGVFVSLGWPEEEIRNKVLERRPP
jgi:hypothetical protein